MQIRHRHSLKRLRGVAAVPHEPRKCVFGSASATDLFSTLADAYAAALAEVMSNVNGTDGDTPVVQVAHAMLSNYLSRSGLSTSLPSPTRERISPGPTPSRTSWPSRGKRPSRRRRVCARHAMDVVQLVHTHPGDRVPGPEHHRRRHFGGRIVVSFTVINPIQAAMMNQMLDIADNANRVYLPFEADTLCIHVVVNPHQPDQKTVSGADVVNSVGRFSSILKIEASNQV